MTEIELAEAEALAMPQDWAVDFRQPGGYTLHTCMTCLRTFHSLPRREICFRCNGGWVDQKATSVYPKPSH